MPDSPVLYSPLNDWHVTQGATMVPFAGMALALQYTGVKPEHLATRREAGLFDISHMVQIRLGGPSRASLQAALQTVFAIDFSTFLPHQSRYSFLLNSNGGILDDVIVSDVDNHFLIVANGARRNHDPACLRRLLPPGISVEVLDKRALVAVQGPKADQALRRVLPGRANIAFMHHQTVMWQETPLWLFRQGYTGEDGWEISLPATVAPAFVESLMGTGLVTPCGLGARDSLRLEAGLPLWGHDIDENTTPIMAGLRFAIAKTRREQADFVGGKALQQGQNPARVRVGLIAEGRQPIREGTELFDGRVAVGRVTSGGVSPSLNVPIAMAMVTSDHARPGTLLEAEVRGKRLPARVSRLPFVPLHYYRPQPLTPNP